MRSEKLNSVIMLVFSALLGAIGQFLFKYSFDNSPAFMPFFSLGLLSYVVSTFIYFYVLSRVHLSWAYSMGGLSYIFTVLLAYSVLGEHVPFLRWIGVLVIAVGVALIGIS